MFDICSEGLYFVRGLVRVIFNSNINKSIIFLYKFELILDDKILDDTAAKNCCNYGKRMRKQHDIW